jgi:hypothetical protein
MVGSKLAHSFSPGVMIEILCAVSSTGAWLVDCYSKTGMEESGKAVNEMSIMIQ